MPDTELHTIKGVEIFAVGKWNDDVYTASDIDGMIEAANEIPVEIPIKRGHSHEIGERAYGWVKRLRRVGEKLLADFVDVPNDVYSWIKARLYNHVSIEVMYNHRIKDRLYPRVLSAVSLLGSERPAVSVLAPLRSVVHQQAASIHTYSHPLRTETTMNEYTFSNTGRIDSKLVALARQFMTTTGEKNFEAAVQQVLADDPSLAVTYSQFVSDQGR